MGAAERRGVRRLLVVLVVALFSLPVVAGAQSSLFAKPTVIVYPFTANASSLDREASSRLATIVATGMANSRKVTVVPPPPGTERKDFLSVARANHVDYYVSGFITPLGNGVSVVEQVVSTVSGIVVASQTAQLSTAAPSTGPEANLSKLFNRRKKATPTPKPSAKPSGEPIAAPPTSAPLTVAVAITPAPAKTAPPPGATTTAGEYAVVAVDGTADPGLRELATQRLLARTKGDRVANAAEACASHSVKAVLSGTLAVRSDPQYGGYSATLELSAHDCGGKLVWQQTHSNDAGGAQGQQLATERAVDAAIGAYLNPPKRRR